MKTNHFIRTYGATSMIIAMSVLPIYSCSSDSGDQPVDPEGKENPEPTAPEQTKVYTVIADLGANDGLSVDANGTLYASNFDNFTGTEVLKVDPDNASTQVAVSNLQAPTGNVVDGSGNIFVVHNVRRAEPESNDLIGDVVKIDADGNRTTLATLPGFPSGIALDTEGNVYVSNYSFPAVHRITPEGERSMYVQNSQLAGGVGIDFDANGNLFVGNFITGDILRIDTDKNVTILATLPTVQQGVVIGYITYFDNAIFATAIGEHAIYRVSLSGEAKIFAGSGTKATTDGTLSEASFDTPNGITADAAKKVLYVTQSEGALRSIAVD